MADQDFANAGPLGDLGNSLDSVLGPVALSRSATSGPQPAGHGSLSAGQFGRAISKNGPGMPELTAGGEATATGEPATAGALGDLGLLAAF